MLRKEEELCLRRTGQENIIWLSSDMNSLLQPLPLSYLFVFFLLQPLAFLLHLLLPVAQHKGDRR
jgi:hypothetical protein